MPAQNSVLRWGLIGCGDISQKRVAPALRDLPEADLIAVNRAQFEKVEDFASEFGAKRVYREWEDLLKDPNIEAVYVATPVDLHAPITIAAAEAGKHVLCEKPMALSLDECDEMIRVCGKNRRKLGIAYYRRFYPVVKRVRELLRAEEIGQVILAQINAFEFFNPGPDHPRAWFVDKQKAGGGPMFDFGCHRVEVLLNLLGGVKGVQGSVKEIAFKRDVEDTALALLDFRSGPQAIISVTHAAFESQDTLSIFGSEGSIHVPVLNKGTLRVVTSQGERTEEHPPDANFHSELIRDFGRAVFGDRDPEVDGEMGREVNRILSLIYESGS